MAADVIAKLAQPFQIGAHTADVSASIGIAVCPDDAAHVEALVKAADRAMYAAKQGGRNRFSYFSESAPAG